MTFDFSPVVLVGASVLLGMSIANMVLDLNDYLKWMTDKLAVAVMVVAALILSFVPGVVWMFDSNPEKNRLMLAAVSLGLAALIELARGVWRYFRED